MSGVLIGLYGFLAMFVLSSIRRNQMAGIANPPMLTAMGWGLFSMSAALAVLLGGLAVLLAMNGTDISLPD